MLQEIVSLVQEMGSGDWDEGLVQRMCQVAQTQLTGRLRPGVTAEDCGGAFPIAAAWMALGACMSVVGRLVWSPFQRVT